MTFELRGEFIPLDALLKATSLAPSGGHAKHLIAEGHVQVDGATELRKTCKIRAGQRVRLTWEGLDQTILVVADPGLTASSPTEAAN